MADWAMMKRSFLAALLCAVAALVISDFVSTLPPCHLSEQKQSQRGSEERCGFTQSLTYRAIDAGVDWIDRRHDFVTAAATIVIALFTGTLWLATDKLWKAGERQMELIRQNAADQSRDVLASLKEAARSAAAMEEVAKHIAVSAQAAKDSVAVVKERGAAQMRAYISVIIGGAVFQEREKNIRFEARPLMSITGSRQPLRFAIGLRLQSCSCPFQTISIFAFRSQLSQAAAS